LHGAPPVLASPLLLSGSPGSLVLVLSGAGSLEELAIAALLEPPASLPDPGGSALLASLAPALVLVSLASPLLLASSRTWNHGFGIVQPRPAASAHPTHRTMLATLSKPPRGRA